MYTEQRDKEIIIESSLSPHHHLPHKSQGGEYSTTRKLSGLNNESNTKPRRKKKDSRLEQTPPLALPGSRG